MFWSIPSDLFLDRMVPYLTIGDHVRASPTCTKLCEWMKDPPFWGSLAAKYGLQLEGAPSKQKLCQKIQEVYKDIGSEMEGKKRMISLFQHHIRNFERLVSDTYLISIWIEPHRREQFSRRHQTDLALVPRRWPKAYYLAIAEDAYCVKSVVKNGRSSILDGLIANGYHPDPLLLDRAIEEEQVECVRSLLRAMVPDPFHFYLNRSEFDFEDEERQQINDLLTEKAIPPSEEEMENLENLRLSFREKDWETAIKEVEQNMALFRNFQGWPTQSHYAIERMNRHLASANQLMPTILRVNALNVVQALFVDGYKLSAPEILAFVSHPDPKMLDLIPDIHIHDTEEIEHLIKEMIERGLLEKVDRLEAKGFQFTTDAFLNACIQANDEQRVIYLLNRVENLSMRSLNLAIKRRYVHILILLINWLKAHRKSIEVDAKKMESVLSNTWHLAQETNNPLILKLIEKLFTEVFRLKRPQ